MILVCFVIAIRRYRVIVFFIIVIVFGLELTISIF